MRRGRTLLLNTLILTATSILMRIVGLGFQVYLSNKIGAAGIGLFILIMSVNMFAATVAISGIRFTTTRLVAEELGFKNHYGIKKAVNRCLFYALVFGMAASLMLYFGAEFIGTVLIGDVRTVLSLKILSLSLPFLSMGAVLAGYFTAVCRIINSAVTQAAEQFIRIGTVVILFVLMPIEGIEKACAIIVIGGVAGEIGSFFLILILYLIDKRRYGDGKTENRNITRRMLGIAVPLAVSAYCRTALSTVQNLIVPRGFKKSGLSSERALSDYGTIQGMVFPVITFPVALFASLSELIVPELTEAQVTGRRNAIASTVKRILKLCLLFSVGIAGILLGFSEELGETIYGEGSVGYYIRIFALLMPVMYLDTVTDGMLRGLGQQMYSMRYNIIDSFISTLLVYFLLPRYAIGGYIFILYFSEIFNFILSIRRLGQITEVEISAGTVIKSVIAIIGAINISAVLMRCIGVPLSAGAGNLTGHILLSGCLYAVFLALFGALGKNDVAWLRAAVRRREA